MTITDICPFCFAKLSIVDDNSASITETHYDCEKCRNFSYWINNDDNKICCLIFHIFHIEFENNYNLQGYDICCSDDCYDDFQFSFYTDCITGVTRLSDRTNYPWKIYKFNYVLFPKEFDKKSLLGFVNRILNLQVFS